MVHVEFLAGRISGGLGLPAETRRKTANTSFQTHSHSAHVSLDSWMICAYWASDRTFRKNETYKNTYRTHYEYEVREITDVFCYIG